MIDVETESMITLAQACREPALRNPKTGKPCHVAQVYRFTQTGARAVDGQRVRLEVVKLPSGMCSSREAISRFIQRLTDPDAEIVTPQTKTRKKQIATAERELAAAGFEVG